MTGQVVEGTSPARPHGLETRGGYGAAVAELHDGWWMRNSDRTAHRLKVDEADAGGGALVSVCGLSDRGWRTVAATGELCCGACGH